MQRRRQRTARTFRNGTIRQHDQRGVNTFTDVPFCLVLTTSWPGGQQRVRRCQGEDVSPAVTGAGRSEAGHRHGPDIASLGPVNRTLALQAIGRCGRWCLWPMPLLQVTIAVPVGIVRPAVHTHPRGGTMSARLVTPVL